MKKLLEYLIGLNEGNEVSEFNYDKNLIDFMVNNLDINDMKKILNYLNNANYNILYSSNFHGAYHSEKVLMFAYLLGKSENLSDDDMQIIMDAAFYHDIGRENDNEDEIHGYSSSMLINLKKDKILSSKIYDSDEFVLYMRSICDAHSKTDDKSMKIFEDYLYENSNLDCAKYMKLLSVLKDADALDRTRFSKTCDAALKEKYLRFDYSRQLIEFSKAINNYYVERDISIKYNRYKKMYGDNYDKKTEFGCLHGIGTDFFKLEGILKNGILSAYASRRKDINLSRNFNGSNKELWISVVDASMIHENGRAFKKYIKNNISFFCLVSNFNLESRSNGAADINNKHEYEDEKYVFECINLDQIHSLIIPNELMNTEIKELNYLTCSSNYSLVCSAINNYRFIMNNNGFYKLKDTGVNNLLDCYNKRVLQFEKMSEELQKQNLYPYLEDLDNIKLKLNVELRNWFDAYYHFILNRGASEKILVSDVIKYILGKCHNCSIGNIIKSDDLNETVIIFDSLEKTEKEEYKKVN